MICCWYQSNNYNFQVAWYWLGLWMIICSWFNGCLSNPSWIGREGWFGHQIFSLRVCIKKGISSVWCSSLCESWGGQPTLALQRGCFHNSNLWRSNHTVATKAHPPIGVAMTEENFLQLGMGQAETRAVNGSDLILIFRSDTQSLGHLYIDLI